MSYRYTRDIIDDHVCRKNIVTRKKDPQDILIEIFLRVGDVPIFPHLFSRRSTFISYHRTTNEIDLASNQIDRSKELDVKTPPLTVLEINRSQPFAHLVPRIRSGDDIGQRDITVREDCHHLHYLDLINK